MKATNMSFVGIIRSLQSNFNIVRTSRVPEVRMECLAKVRQIEERVGIDVVQAVSLAVARGRDVEFEIFEGRCTTKQISVPTRWVQEMLLGNGVGVCPVCGAIVLRDDMDRGIPNSTAAVAT